MGKIRNCALALVLVLGTTAIGPSQSALAASANELNVTGQTALDKLYAESDRARRLGQDARAIIVFPRIVKVGMVVGGQSGEGVMFVDGKPTGYFRISAASVGLQAGGQTFGYALFLMNDGAVNYLKENDGWAIGTGPNVVVYNEGAAEFANTTSLQHDIVAIPFNQKGLMAGVDLEGSKITKLKR